MTTTVLNKSDLQPGDLLVAKMVTVGASELDSESYFANPEENWIKSGEVVMYLEYVEPQELRKKAYGWNEEPIAAFKFLFKDRVVYFIHGTPTGTIPVPVRHKDFSSYMLNKFFKRM